MKKKEQNEYPEKLPKKKKKKKEEKKHAGKKETGKGSSEKKALKKEEQGKKSAGKKDLKKENPEEKILKEKSTGRKRIEKTMPEEKTLQEQGKMEEPVPEQIFHALGDRSRLLIVQILAQEELCAADLLSRLPIVQSTLSHHMKILCEAKLVLCRKQGKWTYYCLHPEGFEQAARWLRTFSGKEMS